MRLCATQLGLGRLGLWQQVLGRLPDLSTSDLRTGFELVFGKS